MTRFTVSLAGVTIDVCAKYSSTRDFCREFLSEGPADFSVTLTREDIDYQRSFTDQSFTDAYLEPLALHRKVSDEIIRYDTILFHGSALAYNGKSYIFTAPSGTGKTTHTRLWLKQLPGSYVLNGDKPYLRMEGQRVMACGTPWRGKEHYGVNEILPLEAICLLERDTYDHIEQIRCEEAFGTLVRQTYRTSDPASLPKIVSLLGTLGRYVRLYHLGCTMNPEAALISSEAMIQK